MKKIFFIAFALASLHSFAQQTPEATVLKLSADIFRFETSNKFDSLEGVCHDKFIVMSSSGEVQSKSQYIQRLKSGSFVHDSIAVEQSTATVARNTAIVSGKGRFAITVSGNKANLHLLYIEVFTRQDEASRWKILAIQASRLPE